MKISYACLKDYIDFNLSPEELAESLTLAGLEVENQEGKDLSNTVLEVNITPNRPDCLSLIGIAREISALTGNPVKYPEVILEEGIKNIEDLTSVTLQDKHLCPRYSAKIIKGIKVGASPQWLIDKLNMVGIRSINNVVDITNFVMIEFGHPTHAFDYDLLIENRIIVRRGINGEQFVSIAGSTCAIKDTMLVIADGKRPVALAGIIGGKNTEVSENTTNILLESAFFEPTQIRRTSKILGIQTESSYRFERGADPEAVLNTSNRCTSLILKLAGGNASKGIIDVYPSAMASRKIILRLERIKKILGTNLSEDQVKSYLDKLGFSVLNLKEKAGHFSIKVPSYRRDVTREIDLIEEIARLHGYDNIEVKNLQFKISRVNLNKFYFFNKKVKTYFQGKGFNEAINYSFINKEMQTMFQGNGKDLEKSSILIQNPISDEWRVMRKSLIPGLLNSLQKNLHAGIEDIRLFEIGRQYNGIIREDSSSNINTPTRDLDSKIKQHSRVMPKEVCSLAGIATSKVERKLWEKGEKRRDIFYLKGIIEIFLDNINLKEYNFERSERSYLPAFNNLIGLYYKGNQIGIIGDLNRRITGKWDIKDRILVFEINLDTLYKGRQETTKFQSISKYPGIFRDIALLVNCDIRSEEIEKFIKQKGTSLLKEMTLFDCYEGKSIPPGKKSLAYSLVFRDNNRTLKDEEVNLIYDNIVRCFAKEFDILLRTQ